MHTRPIHSDLIVIGGGVLGVFHAYHAIEQGLSVTLLERHARPRGATVRNFGQVVPSGMDQQWQRFGRESLQIYSQLQSHFDISVRQLGSIYIASNAEEAALIEELHAINRENDYPSELWTAEQCLGKYAPLREDYCVGGLFFPEEISVNPRLMIHRMHRFLETKAGYLSRFNTCVSQLETGDDGKAVATTTTGDVFSAENAVVCCGSEFKTLYPDLFNRSDLKAVKLQMLRLKANGSVNLPGNILTGLSIRRYESFAQCPSWNEIKANEAPDSFWKQWGVHILFKQEADGSIILGDSHEYAGAADADELDFDIRADINEYFIDEGRKIIDLPAWDIESSWYGIYCQTAHRSGIFSNRVQNNIHVVTGIGGKGMTSAAGYSKHSLKEIFNDQVSRF